MLKEEAEEKIIEEVFEVHEYLKKNSDSQQVGSRGINKMSQLFNKTGDTINRRIKSLVFILDAE